MWNLDLRCFLLGGLLIASSLGAQTPPAKPPVLAPVLLPGEGLAMASADGRIGLYGEASREHPMGSLAKLVWLRLEGDEWGSAGVEFKCTGTLGPYTCWLKKGHGRVDLEKALQESCNLAFLAWAVDSSEEWKHYLGDGAGRLRLEEAFSPFLGNRLPTGDAIPVMTPEWVGDGDLLRTSPEAMLKWLTDTNQELLLAKCRRYLLGSFKKSFLKEGASWWIKTGTAPVVGEPGVTSAWAAGSDGKVVAVLHLPRGRGRAEGLERFKQLMHVTP